MLQRQRRRPHCGRYVKAEWLRRRSGARHVQLYNLAASDPPLCECEWPIGSNGTEVICSMHTSVYARGSLWPLPSSPIGLTDRVAHVAAHPPLTGCTQDSDACVRQPVRTIRRDDGPASCAKAPRTDASSPSDALQPCEATLRCRFATRGASHVARHASHAVGRMYAHSACRVPSAALIRPMLHAETARAAGRTRRVSPGARSPLHGSGSQGHQ
jgi:hypothetical protein